MNWIPFSAQHNGTPAAQLNGDGTLWVDWPLIEKMALDAPLVPSQRCEVVHLMLAMRNRRFADAPRDFYIEDAAP